ncbi:DUF6461 domain-containing protein [Marinitenerispora sediminis]|uniref:Uncharacterized protein n=1 Tax=Marinitenerispora sediminis TaxID=1931232 RepID=A0A368T4M2_9ACTN|nr:DUF6461 domain-containing protein [Marinitenerispora sediminis]RCV50230.1 hypothetical protein DEF28_18625 [Marinitenerispora sediminis]RCV53501.1 hypothetical protein DEF24_20485 [Marinitenerispora sediminis]RCV54568.1 hypothetical protein DEF23_15655 [Marinitenerispora sediminis]
MSVAYARDYAWLQETQPDLAEAYCLSYVRGLSRNEALRRLGANERDMRCLPIAEAVEADLCSESTPPCTAHALSVGGWSVVVEPTGCRAAHPEVYRMLSAETEVVSVRVVMEHRYEFRWVIDGVLQTFFDARSPETRRGTRPDALVDHLSAVGLLPPASETAGAPEPGAAVLAVADRVTGVRVRPAHLAGPLLGAELDRALPLPLR